MEIQLVIRAPNQNFDDQVINCNIDWTVLKLKNHLSEVYPSRPVIQEQKLIYSGHLLLDHLQLKDIIRHEDMQSSVHILHLVCKGNNYSSSPVETPSPSHDYSSQSLPEQSSESSEEDSGISPENVLRHRFHSAVPQMNNIQMQSQQIPANTSPVFPMDPQVVAQISAMQQMYAQYVSQYWQSMNIAGAAVNYPLNPIVSNIQLLQNNLNNASHENVPQQHTNQRNNAPAVQPVEDNEFANRDWLDQLFLYFRFLILLCIMYFYTTPERFMLVIIAVVVAFLYHEGWFVRQGIAEAVIGQRNRGQIEPNPNNANEQQQINENEGQDGHELEAVMDGEDPSHAQNPDTANNNNQVFSPLTFLTTFFSSLIPEPPPPVNIN